MTTRTCVYCGKQKQDWEGGMYVVRGPKTRTDRIGPPIGWSCGDRAACEQRVREGQIGPGVPCTRREKKQRQKNRTRQRRQRRPTPPLL